MTVDIHSAAVIGLAAKAKLLRARNDFVQTGSKTVDRNIPKILMEENEREIIEDIDV